MPIITRRSLLWGLVAAPAVVRYASLMPVRGIVMPVFDANTIAWDTIFKIEYMIIDANDQPLRILGLNK